MYCTVCGLGNIDNASFCSKCGHPFDQNKSLMTIGDKNENISRAFPELREKIQSELVDITPRSSPFPPPVAGRRVPDTTAAITPAAASTIPKDDFMMRFNKPMTPEVHRQWNTFFSGVLDSYSRHSDWHGPETLLNYLKVFDPNEKRIAMQPYEAMAFTGVDLQYDGNLTGAVVGNGLGLAGAVGFLIGDQVARNRVKKAAEIKWRLENRGDICVSDCGIYLFLREEIRTNGAKYKAFHSSEVLTVSYQDFVSAQMTAWDSIEFQTVFTSERLALISNVASLVFFFWAAGMYPDHPQLRDVIDGWKR